MIILVDKTRCEEVYFHHQIIIDFIWDFYPVGNIVQKVGFSFILILGGSINRYFKEFFDGKYYE